MLPDVAISIKEVSKKFGEKTAVNNISLEIKRGQVLTMLGPNGAGKSTTINMMLGILKPTHGQILLNGKNPLKASSRQVLGAMQQHIGLPETLNPLELIRLWSSFYYTSLDEKLVIEMAALTEICKTPFKELSGGQKRRVAFALAICGNPQILFLDEPSAGLDIFSRNLLWNQIRNFAATGKTVILCTHYLDEADALSDRIVLMNDGNIIADDSPVNIKKTVGAKIIKCKTTIPLIDISKIRGVEKAELLNDIINIKAQDPEKVLMAMFLTDPDISELEVNTINLEEAFLKLNEKSHEIT